MKMNSLTRGMHTSEPEVTNVSSHGIWLLADGREHFLSYDDFSWFKDAPVGKIMNVEQASPGHFRWPELDIDIGIDTIEHPEKFPLTAR